MQRYLKLYSMTFFTFIAGFAIGQSRVVTGKVVDTTGKDVVNATIQEKKSKRFVSSDETAILKSPCCAMGTLSIFFIGYEPIELATGEQLEITVVMHSTSAWLDEVLVTALSVRREKRNLTYSTQS